eukprot:gnl/Hemi2/20043_TR6649_c0_g4_i1.p1 gnl/Hemi2/20043_TR6649_c0_g4~~gnl/Hemi2/20043_TR6649_c0_g4_i1.p1  ORF type:complete len:195 (-),score=38.91 gnl/Hemi2/20043_TR6649_c0_g4_i1:90-674(-)
MLGVRSCSRLLLRSTQHLCRSALGTTRASSTFAWRNEAETEPSGIHQAVPPQPLALEEDELGAVHVRPPVPPLGYTLGEDLAKAQHRRAIIYPQSKTAMQQGRAKTVGKWRLYFEVAEGARWAHPLMGWTAGSDPLVQMRDLNFKSKEDAAEYCVTNGWDYELHEAGGDFEPPKKVERKTYKKNFKWKPDPPTD